MARGRPPAPHVRWVRQTDRPSTRARTMVGAAWSAFLAPLLIGDTAGSSTAATEGDSPGGLAFFVDRARGSDANPGTSARPWKTIAFAADEAASAAQKHETPITVSVAAGIYTEPLFFGPAQSGRASASVTFRGVAGAVISGGLTIPKTALRPSTAGPRGMLTADLIELGVNITDLGSLAPGTLGECSGDQIELVEDGAVMTLARWPNSNISKTSDGDEEDSGQYPAFSNWSNIRRV